MAALAIVAGLAAGQALVVSQAQAVSGLARVTNTSGFDSSARKTVAARCPTGKRVLGGGGAAIGGRGQVVIERLQPTRTATDDRFVVGAREDETGYARDWRLTAHALCANPLAGLQIASGQSALTSDGLQSALAFCPSGQDQVGFGGRVEGGTGQAYMTDLYPSFVAPPPGTFMRAREDADGLAGAWRVVAYTVCADQAAGFTAVSAGAPASSANKSATVTCPPGSQVHSAGLQLAGRGISPIDGVHVDKVAIDPQLDGVTVRGVEDETATSDTWSVRANALCAP